MSKCCCQRQFDPVPFREILNRFRGIEIQPLYKSIDQILVPFPIQGAEKFKVLMTTPLLEEGSLFAYESDVVFPARIIL